MQLDELCAESLIRLLVQIRTIERSLLAGTRQQTQIAKLFETFEDDYRAIDAVIELLGVEFCDVCSMAIERGDSEVKTTKNNDEEQGTPESLTEARSGDG